eukprot:748829-Hanusia_phi.AAC.1
MAASAGMSRSQIRHHLGLGTSLSLEHVEVETSPHKVSRMRLSTATSTLRTALLPTSFPTQCRCIICAQARRSEEPAQSVVAKPRRRRRTRGSSGLNPRLQAPPPRLAAA